LRLSAFQKSPELKDSADAEGRKRILEEQVSQQERVIAELAAETSGSSSGEGRIVPDETRVYASRFGIPDDLTRTPDVLRSRAASEKVEGLLSDVSKLKQEEKGNRSGPVRREPASPVDRHRHLLKGRNRHQLMRSHQDHHWSHRQDMESNHIHRFEGAKDHQAVRSPRQSSRRDQACRCENLHGPAVQGIPSSMCAGLVPVTSREVLHSAVTHNSSLDAK
jgi:hypothetical protein